MVEGDRADEPSAPIGWGPYLAWLLVCSAVVLALQGFVVNLSSLFWRVLGDVLEPWKLAGLPYYGLWIPFLLLWRCVRPEVRIAWRAPPGTWTRRNLVYLVALLIATEAVYGFKLSRVAIGWLPWFEQSTSLGYSLSAAIAAPIIEELLFRGYLWHELSRRAPTARAGLISAVLVSSILFALSHLPVLFGPYPAELGAWPPLHAHFAFGVLVAIARWRFRSIGVGVLIHAAWNAI
jgi:membrane protease YdiL (CAAX protease family)